MDREKLAEIVRDAAHRQFWIVLWGIPENSPDEDKQIFQEPIYEEGLTQNVPDMNIGDVLFVHRIHVSKIIYVGEVIAQPRQNTAAESETEGWRKRWNWSVAIKNLTPTYGRYWRTCAERTFTLGKQFNELHPQTEVNIGRLQHGMHVRIPEAFAKYLLNEIISAEIDESVREDKFRAWLARTRGTGTVDSRISNCRVVKTWEGDLDEHFDRYQLRAVLERLTYTKEDERYGRPARHNIPIAGNVYDGTATYKAAVNLYKRFRVDQVGLTSKPESDATHLASERPTAPPKTDSHQRALETQSGGASQVAAISAVSASLLADWRRMLVRLLVVLEKSGEPIERIGIGERIGRLQRSGLIPREVSAMMRTITEMRNATEYEAKTLSRAESEVVKAAWAALQEWAESLGIDSLG